MYVEWKGGVERELEAVKTRGKLEKLNAWLMSAPTRDSAPIRGWIRGNFYNGMIRKALAV
jgi:hypothetical protein